MFDELALEVTEKRNPYQRAESREPSLISRSVEDQIHVE